MLPAAKKFKADPEADPFGDDDWGDDDDLMKLIEDEVPTFSQMTRELKAENHTSTVIRSPTSSSKPKTFSFKKPRSLIYKVSSAGSNGASAPSVSDSGPSTSKIIPNQQTGTVVRSKKAANHQSEPALVIQKPATKPYHIEQSQQSAQLSQSARKSVLDVNPYKTNQTSSSTIHANSAASSQQTSKELSATNSSKPKQQPTSTNNKLSSTEQSGVEKQVQELTRKYHANQGEIKWLRTSLNDKDKQITELRNKLNNDSHQYKREHEADVSTLQHDINKLKSELQFKVNEISSLQQTITSLKADRPRPSKIKLDNDGFPVSTHTTSPNKTTRVASPRKVNTRPGSASPSITSMSPVKSVSTNTDDITTIEHAEVKEADIAERRPFMDNSCKLNRRHSMDYNKLVYNRIVKELDRINIRIHLTQIQENGTLLSQYDEVLESVRLNSPNYLVHLLCYTLHLTRISTQHKHLALPTLTLIITLIQHSEHITVSERSPYNMCTQFLVCKYSHTVVNLTDFITMSLSDTVNVLMCSCEEETNREMRQNYRKCVIELVGVLLYQDYHILNDDKWRNKFLTLLNTRIKKRQYLQLCLQTAVRLLQSQHYQLACKEDDCLMLSVCRVLAHSHTHLLTLKLLIEAAAAILIYAQKTNPDCCHRVQLISSLVLFLMNLFLKPINNVNEKPRIVSSCLHVLSCCDVATPEAIDVLHGVHAELSYVKEQIEELIKQAKLHSTFGEIIQNLYYKSSPADHMDAS